MDFDFIALEKLSIKNIINWTTEINNSFCICNYFPKNFAVVCLFLLIDFPVVTFWIK
jgi:hypothetical protein